MCPVPHSLPSETPGRAVVPPLHFSPPPMWAMVHAAVYAVSVSFLFVIFSVGAWGGGNGAVGVGAPSWGHRGASGLTCSSLLPFLPPPRQ